MNNTDWGFWALMAMLVLLLLSGIFMPGCAAPQRRDAPTVAPTPAIQLWQAAKTSNWLATVSIIGVGVGIFIVFKGKEWGMGLVISCCVILFMTLAVARFAWWIALCGLIGSVSFLCVSILTRKRALVEIIKGVQIYREDTTDHVDLDLQLSEAQKSKSTQKIVQEIKADLKVKGEI